MSRRTSPVAAPSTPLRRWHARTGRSWSWLAREARVSLRTVMRAAAGDPVSAPFAAAIARVTFVPLADIPVLDGSARPNR